MPAGRPKAITKEIEETIAELFFLAFTDEQVALYCGISSKTIQRFRHGELCPAIKIAELDRERAYRRKIWNAKGFWQGAAWFLERKYPTQFAKPEIQLAITNNTLNQSTTNNVLIIQAEVAGQIKTRLKSAEAKIDQLLKDKRGGNGNGTNGKGGQYES